MAKKQTTDIKEKSVEALQQDVEEVRKELFTLHLDNVSRKLKNTRSIFFKRQDIAHMLTVIRMKQLTEKQEVANG